MKPGMHVCAAILTRKGVDLLLVGFVITRGHLLLCGLSLRVPA